MKNPQGPGWVALNTNKPEIHKTLFHTDIWLPAKQVFKRPNLHEVSAIFFFLKGMVGAYLFSSLEIRNKNITPA